VGLSRDIPSVKMPHQVQVWGNEKALPISAKDADETMIRTDKVGEEGI
jgi:hypothetical protein